VTHDTLLLQLPHVTQLSANTSLSTRQHLAVLVSSATRLGPPIISYHVCSSQLAQHVRCLLN
jgi:hypothetical protein